MITAASAAAQPQNLDFEVGDISEWAPPEDLDVLVSNAALQWIPGHQDLLRAWAAALGSGAWLAFQVPGNFSAPSHVLMRHQSASSKWRPRLDGVLRHEDAVSEPADYLALLLEAGFDADAWETTYLHVLQGPDPVLEWVRGTGLRPVLAALEPQEASEFETEYAAALRQAYRAGPHGTVFPFRRIFCVARKR
jgi:trans-aconitate 2-methyltransferase